ncbi:MAG: nuclear transport factor 2 family protein [Chloroflexi bacterium]|nr:nuclear transport factor 2 family protein [Chloroflexota bacterium]
MHADSTIEAEVQAVLARLAEVYVTRDAAVMADIFAPDPDVVMYSPGAERVVGLAAIQAKAQGDWTKSEAGKLVYRWISVSAAGPVAWAATEADFTVRAAGQERTLPVRITFVLERRGTQWLIVHAHYSL